MSSPSPPTLPPASLFISSHTLSISISSSPSSSSSSSMISRPSSQSSSSSSYGLDIVSSTASSSSRVYPPPRASLPSLSSLKLTSKLLTFCPRSNESSYTNLISGVKRRDTFFPMFRRQYPSIFFNPLIAFCFPRSSPRIDTNTFTTCRSLDTSTSDTVTITEITLSTPMRSSGDIMLRMFLSVWSMLEISLRICCCTFWTRLGFAHTTRSGVTVVHGAFVCEMTCVFLRPTRNGARAGHIEETRRAALRCRYVPAPERDTREEER
mmetsp:Transcript_142/g.430  ORF Transcript_142/g.430 Transcript_142/m.430 type:complete len:266 (-) Transcript_142:43-840(-)